jgi:hypothetical protein
MLHQLETQSLSLSLSKMGGCCGDEDEILQHLNPPHDPITTTTTADSGGQSATEITSPTDSNLSSALTCSDILRLILERLTVPDLARASCVCRVWNSVASDHELVAKAFKAPWRLNDVIGKPVSGSFWRDNGIGKFAISHRVVRGDTVASLAVKYSVQVSIQFNFCLVVEKVWERIGKYNLLGF